MSNSIDIDHDWKGLSQDRASTLCLHLSRSGPIRFGLRTGRDSRSASTFSVFVTLCHAGVSGCASAEQTKYCSHLSTPGENRSQSDARRKQARYWLVVILPTKYGRAIVKGPGCMALWQVMQHDLSNATTARLSCGQLVLAQQRQSRRLIRGTHWALKTADGHTDRQAQNRPTTGVGV